MMMQSPQHFRQESSWNQRARRQPLNLFNQVPAPAHAGSEGKWRQQTEVMPKSKYSKPTADKPVGMQEQLQALQQEDPQKVLIVRRIHTLGFHSAQKLQDHFSKFGPVKSVLVPYSRVKATPGRRARARTGNIGFVVMQSAHAAQTVLWEGDSQEILGHPIAVTQFQKRETGCLDQEGDESCYIPDVPSPNKQPTVGLVLQRCGGALQHSPLSKQYAAPWDPSMEFTNYSTAAGSSESSGSSTPRPRWADFTHVGCAGNDCALYSSLENRLESMVLADQGFVTDDEF